jgi:hypothetical protein
MACPGAVSRVGCNRIDGVHATPRARTSADAGNPPIWSGTTHLIHLKPASEVPGLDAQALPLRCTPNAALAWDRLAAILSPLWRGAGAADRAALEMPCARKGTAGSNPALSDRALHVGRSNARANSFVLGQLSGRESNPRGAEGHASRGRRRAKRGAGAFCGESRPLRRTVPSGGLRGRVTYLQPPAKGIISCVREGNVCGS